MKHITYLTTGERVCEHPEKIGHDFVLGDFTNDEPHCVNCSNLIAKYNKEEHDNELLFGANRKYFFESDQDKIAAARGLVYGLVAGSVLWTFILFLFWFFFVL